MDPLTLLFSFLMLNQAAGGKTPIVTNVTPTKAGAKAPTPADLDAIVSQALNLPVFPGGWTEVTSPPADVTAREAQLVTSLTPGSHKIELSSLGITIYENANAVAPTVSGGIVAMRVWIPTTAAKAAAPTNPFAVTVTPAQFKTAQPIPNVAKTEAAAVQTAAANLQAGVTATQAASKGQLKTIELSPAEQAAAAKTAAGKSGKLETIKLRTVAGSVVAGTAPIMTDAGVVVGIHKVATRRPVVAVLAPPPGDVRAKRRARRIAG
jgi:hypothetical protein